MESILVDQKIIVWQRISIPVPEGKSKEKFINELYKDDPRCNEVENFAIDTLYDTETVLISEFYRDNGEYEPNKIWKNPVFVGNILLD